MKYTSAVFSSKYWRRNIFNANPLLLDIWSSDELVSTRLRLTDGDSGVSIFLEGMNYGDFVVFIYFWTGNIFLVFLLLIFLGHYSPNLTFLDRYKYHQQLMSTQKWYNTCIKLFFITHKFQLDKIHRKDFIANENKFNKFLCGNELHWLIQVIRDEIVIKMQKICKYLNKIIILLFIVWPCPTKPALCVKT